MAKRPSAKEVDISSISEEGKLYTVSGIVVDADIPKGEGILDDGTGTLRFILDNMVFVERIAEGRYVRLIGRAYLTDDGIVLRAEVVNNLNIQRWIYKKVKELERRVYHEGGV